MNLILLRRIRKGGLRLLIYLSVLSSLPFLSPAQVVTTITYAGSGLSTTTNNDVFAGQPSVGGYQHKTITSNTSEILPPGFNGTSVNLAATTFDGATHCSGNTCTTDAHVATDGFQIGYTFSPNAIYFVSMNLTGQIPSYYSQYVGMGVTVGSPVFTTSLGYSGQAMAGMNPNGVPFYEDDNFLLEPPYSSLYQLTYTNNVVNNFNVGVPSFTVPASTTGLNIEAIPEIGASTTSLGINSVTIRQLPLISPVTYSLCSSQNYSIASSWPVTWSISPASGIATLSSSGTNATLTKISDGDLTLTATLTDPNGKTFAVSQAIHVGLPTSSIPIYGIPQGYSVCENSSFNVYTEQAPPPDNSFFWSVSPGTLLPGGQGTSEVYVQLPGGYTYSNEYDVVDGFLITLQLQNSCGVSNWQSTVAGNILGCGGSGTSTGVSRTLATTGTTGLDNITVFGTYPNPADQSATVTVPSGMNTATATITLSDIFGRQLKKIPTVSSSNTISLTGLAAGIYLVQIFDGRKLVATRKLVKK